MSTKKHELEMAARGEGCLGKAADDEPVFILRAQDLSSPAVVGFWISLNKDAPPEKLAEADRLMWAMRRWPHRKQAD